MHVMFLEIFAGFFGNIFNFVIGLIFLLVGVIIGIILYRLLTRPQNQIIYCRERDGRALELNIAKEDHVSLETNTKPPLRFFKFGRSYELRKRGRPYTRHFGKEGTAFTWILEGHTKIKGKLKQVTKRFKNLGDMVKSVWGQEFFATVPEERREQLAENNVLLTVNLEPGITPKGYEPITESVILDKADEDAARLWSASIKGAIQEPLMKVLIYLGCGAGIGWILNFVMTGV